MTTGRPVELIYGKKDRSPSSCMSYGRSYGYYNHVRSYRPVAMEILSSPSLNSVQNFIYYLKIITKLKKKLLVTVLVKE